MNISLTLRIAAVVLLLQIIPGFAQEYEEFTLEDSVTVTAQKEGRIATYNLTATKLALPLRLTPASVGVVTQAIFQAQNSIVLGDALKNISGINVQNGNGVHDYFLIRGFNSLENGLVLTDGTAEPEVTFYNLYNIARVEALKGPGAFLYGANPLSGTVNLVRKQPVFGQFARLNTSYGSFNSLRGNIDANYGDADAGYAFRVNGLYQKSDFYRDNKNNTVYAVNPSLTVRLTDGLLLHADVEHVNSDYTPDSGIPLLFGAGPPVLPDVERTNAYETPFDFSEQKVNRLKAQLVYHLNAKTTLRSKFYWTDLDWNTRGTLYSGAFPDPSGSTPVFRLMNGLKDRQKLLGNQLELLTGFNSGGIRHKLIAGVEYSRLKDDYKLELAFPMLQPGFPGVPVIDLFNPVETATDAVNDSFFPLLNVDATISSAAPYLVDQVSLSRQLQLFLGGRYDFATYDDKRMIFSQQPGVPDFLLIQDTTYNKFNPLAGVVYSPSENVSVYGNIGQAFAPPSTQNGPMLKPEESDQIEFGLKSELLEGRLRANIAYFDLRKENFTIPQSDGNAIAASQKSTGLELEVVAEPLDGLLLFANYAFTDAELTEYLKFSPVVGDPGRIAFDYEGNRPAFAPEHILNVYAVKDFRNGLGLSGGIRYIGSQFIDANNVFELDGYVTVDAAISYRYQNARLGLNLNNVTDTEYFTRGYDIYSVTPGNPFAAYGTLEISL